MKQLPFPDFGFAPADYKGNYFHLSQHYPVAKPDATRVPVFFGKLPAKLTTDFTKWREYMMELRAYCFEGNLLTVDWCVEKNKVRKWYHIPWQHYGPSGRECIHGLTREAPVADKQLAAGQGLPPQGGNYTTYAVGFFNEFGGYAIGQVWKDHLDPDISATNGPNGGFPEGTVISKLLFVDVPVEQVPSLVNPKQWDAYIQNTYQDTARSIRKVSLIQMDVAVRDNRAPTGWFLGTFQYNGALNRPNGWDNLVPLGIMWGNDPTITDDTYTNPTPTVTKINPNLKESAINADTNELPPTHLGWNGRLNGPVDNPRSACMSCHGTAEVPTLTPSSPLFISPAKDRPAVGTPEWMRWFQNIPCGQAFDKDKGALSADYSLQLAAGVSNFQTWWKQAMGGLYAPAQKSPTDARAAMTGGTSAGAATSGAPLMKTPAAIQGQTVHPITRGGETEPAKK